jgi:hypothetical protein
MGFDTQEPPPVGGCGGAAEDVDELAELLGAGFGVVLLAVVLGAGCDVLGAAVGAFAGADELGCGAGAVGATAAAAWTVTRNCGDPAPHSRDRNAAKVDRDGEVIARLTVAPGRTALVTVNVTVRVLAFVECESSTAPGRGALRAVSVASRHEVEARARAWTTPDRWWFVRVSTSCALTIRCPLRAGTLNARKAVLRCPF